MVTTDEIQIGEQEITLANTTSLLSLDVCDSGVGEGNRTPVASSDLHPSHPTSPQAVTVNIFQHSIFTTNSNLNGVTLNRGDRNSGGQY